MWGDILFKKNIYLIPITDYNVEIKDENNLINLHDYLKKYYPKLAKLEDDKASIICKEMSSEGIKKEIELIELKKKEYCEKFNIPYYIIAVGNKNNLKELFTKEVLYSRDSSILDIRKITKAELLEYYNIKYDRKIEKFINRRNFKLINMNDKGVKK